MVFAECVFMQPKSKPVRFTFLFPRNSISIENLLFRFKVLISDLLCKESTVNDSSLLGLLSEVSEGLPGGGEKLGVRDHQFTFLL
jgi:hypothetical protein